MVSALLARQPTYPIVTLPRRETHFFGEENSGYLMPVCTACFSEWLFLFIYALSISFFPGWKIYGTSALPYVPNFAILITVLGLCVSQAWHPERNSSAPVCSHPKRRQVDTVLPLLEPTVDALRLVVDMAYFCLQTTVIKPTTSSSWDHSKSGLSWSLSSCSVAYNRGFILIVFEFLYFSRQDPFCFYFLPWSLAFVIHTRICITESAMPSKL